jgi:hypothetical protein
MPVGFPVQNDTERPSTKRITNLPRYPVGRSQRPQTRIRSREARNSFVVGTSIQTEGAKGKNQISQKWDETHRRTNPITQTQSNFYLNRRQRDLVSTNKKGNQQSNSVVRTNTVIPSAVRRQPNAIEGPRVPPPAPRAARACSPGRWPTIVGPSKRTLQLLWDFSAQSIQAYSPVRLPPAAPRRHSLAQRVSAEVPREI